MKYIKIFFLFIFVSVTIKAQDTDTPKRNVQHSYRSLAELLVGRVAGLNITSTGTFGETTANIRGQHSFMLSSEPLVVLNGIAIGTLNEVNNIKLWN
jgi:hypothetical protein